MSPEPTPQDQAAPNRAVPPRINDINTVLAPAIYASAEEFLSEPFTPPANRKERLERILKNIDRHAAEVQGNIRRLFFDERQRLLDEAAERPSEEAAQDEEEEALDRGVEDVMIASMSTPMPKDSMGQHLDQNTYMNQYNIVNCPPIDKGMISAPTYEKYISQATLVTGVVGANNAAGYLWNHTAQIKKRYENALEKERAWDNEPYQDGDTAMGGT